MEVRLPVGDNIEVLRALRAVLTLTGTQTDEVRHPTSTEVADAVDEVSLTGPEAASGEAISVALVPWEVVLVRVP